MDYGKSEYGLFSGAAIFDYSDEKKPIIEHLLYERDTIWIDSKAGEGKSLVAKTLICNLTTGTPFLETYNIHRPYKVLYVQTEGDRSETLERLNLLVEATPINNDNWVHMNWDGLALNSQGGFKEFQNRIWDMRMDYDVIIFDPLYTTVKGSLKEDDVASDWIRNIRKLRAQYNCAFIILAHKPKDSYLQNGKLLEKGADNLFGSAYWIAFANQNFKLTNHNGLLTLRRGKQRSKKIVDLIEMKIVETDTMLKLTNREELSDRNSVVIYDMIEKADKPLSVKRILAGTDIPQATIYRVLHNLLGEKRIEKIKVDRGYYYQIINPPVENEKLEGDSHSEKGT